jgi:glycosyltransferase involved in cell wall biosynthesis
MKRVTTVIPCFNQGQFLAEAIESVLAQTRRPEQIIIIDDGSTDNTAAVAARFKAVDYLFQKNRGLAAARNAGLGHAIADYILFLDSDDILIPTAIEHCLAAFSAQPDAAFVYGGFRLVDSSRELIREALPQSPADHYAALLRGNHIGMHGTVMYNAGVVLRVGGFDETLSCCEDYDLYLRLAKDYPVGVYRSISAEYRMHGENMTRNAPMMLRGARSVLARHADTARTCRDWRVAYSEGQRFWTKYYGGLIAGQLATEFASRRQLSKLVSLMAAGLWYDRLFVLRLARRFARASKTRLRQLRPSARVR